LKRESDVQTLTVDSTPTPAPGWLRAVAVLGFLWNVYGTYQFAGTFTASGQAAMTAGMTPAQAALYLSLPAWISGVFALGVFGGLVGSILLALQRTSASAVLGLSAFGYGLLFAGDAHYGVFAAIPAQLAILAVVVLIAVGLLWVSRLAGHRGLLR
jgi:hypothetical protein